RFRSPLRTTPRFLRSGPPPCNLGVGMKNNNKKGKDLAHLQESLEAAEQRFHTLVRLSSDFYWETDAAHRLKELIFGAGHRSPVPREHLLGKKRWDVPSAFPDAAGWRTHAATLDAHLPFRSFEF